MQKTQKTFKQRAVCAVLAVLWVLSLLPQSGLASIFEPSASADDTQTVVETNTETEDEEEEAEIVTIADLARLDGTSFAGSAMETLSDDEAGIMLLSDEEEDTTGDGEEDNDDDDDDDGSSTAATWNFSIHYVEQDDSDSNNVTVTDDFDLKYQFEFSTDGGDIAAGQAVIRIKANLLWDDTLNDGAGGYVLPSDVGVPEFSKDDGSYECLDSEGNYKHTEKIPSATDEIIGNNYSSTSPFNYYYETNKETGDTYIVFVNYRNIPSGTNVAIQVLYDDLKAFDFHDLDTWDLDAQATVNTVPSTEEHLTGTIDTSVSLDKVTKNAYRDSSVSYTPGLYTVKQIEKFTGTTLESSSGFTDANGKFTSYLNLDGTLNTTDFVYTVFRVEIAGTCNQRFSLSLDDIFPDDPDYKSCGSIVGISLGNSRTNTTVTQNDDGSYSCDLGYYYVTSSDLTAFTKTGDQIYNSEEFSATCWIVAAYSVDELKELAETYPDNVKVDSTTGEITYCELLNSVKVTINPYDGADSSETSASSSNNMDSKGNSVSEWEPYEWDYDGVKGGDGFVAKDTSKSRNCDENLNGWFEGFGNCTDTSYDAGVAFTVNGNVQTYGATHTGYQSSSGYDKYTGGYVTTVFADDVLYATTNDGSDPVELTGNDYYINGGTINLRDIGINVWDDETCEPTSDTELSAKLEELNSAENIDRSWKIYGLVYDSDTGGSTWELIQTVDFNTIAWDDTKGTVTINNVTVNNNPYYRIKVVHNTVDYSVSVSMKLNYKMIKGSTQFDEFYSVWSKKDSTTNPTKSDYCVTLTNYSAFTAYDNSGKCLVGTAEGSLPDGITMNYYSDEEPNGGSDTTKTGINLIRKTADVNLKSVQETSNMTKTVETSKNNANNSRVNITYTMAAYDGYQIFSEDVKAIYEAKSDDSNPNNRTTVVFYDLLPYKVHYDGSVTPTVARLTSIDQNFSATTHNSASWDTSGVTLVDTEITADYNDTGRELVKFTLQFTGDPSVYNKVNSGSTSNRVNTWYTAYGISFGAYVTWSNYTQAKDETNIAAYVNGKEGKGTTKYPPVGNNVHRRCGGELWKR